MITSKIIIKPHLKEYAEAKFGTPCRFPDKTDLYHVIYDLLEKRMTPTIDKGNFEIVLPARAIGKRPESYNYISMRSARIIERRIENMFLAELHDLLLDHKHRYGVPYIESIHLFRSRYNLESISEDTLWKNCYRWKQLIRRKEKRKYSR